MPNDLTDAECDKIAAAAIARDYTTPPRGTPFDISVIYRIIVRAGLAAGRERENEACAKVAMNAPDAFGTLADDYHKECSLVAARLIRERIK